MGAPCHSLPLCLLVPRGAVHSSDLCAAAGDPVIALGKVTESVADLLWWNHHLIAVFRGVQSRAGRQTADGRHSDQLLSSVFVPIPGCQALHV